MKKFIALCITALVLMSSSAYASDKIGIIGAMDVEVNLLKEAANISRRVIEADMEFCEGRIDSKDVVIVKCGMGKVNAGICAQILIDLFDVSHVINTGTSGSLSTDLKIGDVVIAVDAVQHDYDVSAIGFKKGEIPYTGKYAFECDKELAAKAINAAHEAAPETKTVKGRVCTSDRFIETPEQADAITSVFGGECCEMEGGAIAQVCYMNHVPFVIIRGICDTLHGEAQQSNYSEIEAQIAKLCASITKNMIENF